MYRSYQTALQLLNPDVVFILGDLTDEGKWASSEQWNRYVHRAGEVFFTPKKIRLHMVMGNHDVGFHYDITQSKLNRYFNVEDLSHVNRCPYYFSFQVCTGTTSVGITITDV